ncbi:hypothetical protein PAMP_022143 [Pampus punctatissimus]
MWSLACMVLPGVGFVFICMGAYLVSLQNEPKYTWRVIPAYIMIVVGFLTIVVWVFWTICHSMKSKLYQRGGHQQHIQVYTIERPSSFPPSYEEYQGSCLSPYTDPEFEAVVRGLDLGMSLAPPLYSEDSLEVPNCMWSWEQPPSYSQIERMLQGQVDVEEQREAFSGH